MLICKQLRALEFTLCRHQEMHHLPPTAVGVPLLE